MNRLTKENFYARPEDIVKFSSVGIANFYNKLREYEDIDKELGIEYPVLIKALTNGIWCKETDYYDHFDVRGIERYGLSVISKICNYPECDFTCEYKDYGKTWSLTKEELENVN